MISSGTSLIRLRAASVVRFFFVPKAAITASKRRFKPRGNTAYMLPGGFDKLAEFHCAIPHNTVPVWACYLKMSLKTGQSPAPKLSFSRQMCRLTGVI